LIVGERGDRLDALAQIAPEAAMIRRAGEAARDSNDRDAGGSRVRNHLRSLRVRRSWARCAAASSLSSRPVGTASEKNALRSAADDSGTTMVRLSSAAISQAQKLGE